MNERYFPERIFKELRDAKTSEESRRLTKEVAYAVPVELEITRYQEKTMFLAFREYLLHSSYNFSEIKGKLSTERMEQIESIRAIMPRLARDIGFTGEHEDSLSLMYMGLPDMVAVGALEKLRDESMASYEKMDPEKRKGSITEHIVRTTEYFLKKKKESSSK
jgi:hypothetical protein